MCWLVVVESGLMTLPRSFVLLCRYSYRQLPLRALDFVVNFANPAFLEWICSNYAEGSCDSNVPFCDMCSTQLHVDPSVFLLSLVGGIPLVGHTRYLSLLLGSFLHFWRFIHVFVQLMCPSHLDPSASFEASILVVET